MHLISDILPPPHPKSKGLEYYDQGAATVKAVPPATGPLG